MKKNKIIHIGIIIVGIFFIALSAFHSNIWFDEAYSCGMAWHSFKDIWNIGANDVHPILYYWILHILYIIFGNNLIVYRLFSVICIGGIGILGYTHVRKDFGKRVGIIFSFLSFFMPVMCVYAIEIRMYALSAFLTTLTSIYAYRISKKNTILNWTIFSLSSLALAHTHYYGLMTAGLINVALFIYALKNKGYIKRFIIQAIIEVALYLPWLIYFLMQKLNSGAGFWVKLTFPGTLIEILNFQYKGFADLDFSYSFINIFTLAIAGIVYLYIGYLIYKERKENNNIKYPMIALSIYIGVILGALVVCIVIPILFSRYLYVITPLLIFVISYFFAKEKKVWITIIFMVGIMCMAFYNNYKLLQDNYSNKNMQQVRYMQEEIKADDIIIYSNFSESLMTIYFPNNTQYYLNLEHWDIEKAYSAFGPQMNIVEDYDFLNNYTGRIWIVESGDSEIYKNIENYDVILESKSFGTDYHNYYFNIMLVCKK